MTNGAGGECLRIAALVGSGQLVLFGELRRLRIPAGLWRSWLTDRASLPASSRSDRWFCAFADGVHVRAGGGPRPRGAPPQPQQRDDHRVVTPAHRRATITATNQRPLLDRHHPQPSHQAQVRTRPLSGVGVDDRDVAVGVLKPDDADFNVPVQSSLRSTSTGKAPHRAVSRCGPLSGDCIRRHADGEAGPMTPDPADTSPRWRRQVPPQRRVTTLPATSCRTARLRRSPTGPSTTSAEASPSSTATRRSQRLAHRRCRDGWPLPVAWPRRRDRRNNVFEPVGLAWTLRWVWGAMRL